MHPILCHSIVFGLVLARPSLNKLICLSVVRSFVVKWRQNLQFEFLNRCANHSRPRRSSLSRWLWVLHKGWFSCLYGWRSAWVFWEPVSEDNTILCRHPACMFELTQPKKFPLKPRTYIITFHAYLHAILFASSSRDQSNVNTRIWRAFLYFNVRILFVLNICFAC